MTDKITNRKLPDDEELEKLWAGMSREAAREAANQNSPQRRTQKNKPKKVVYAEPADYFPEELRRKYKLGEFAEPKEEKVKPPSDEKESK